MLLGVCRVHRRVGAEALDQLALLGRRSQADHARAVPLRELHREAAGPARGGLDDHGLTGLEPRAAMDQRVRRQPLEQQRGRLVVGHAVGHRNQHRLGHRDLLRVAAVHQQRRHPPPVGRPARRPRRPGSAAAPASRGSRSASRACRRSSRRPARRRRRPPPPPAPDRARPRIAAHPPRRTPRAESPSRSHPRGPRSSVRFEPTPRIGNVTRRHRLRVVRGLWRGGD